MSEDAAKWGKEIRRIKLEEGAALREWAKAINRAAFEMRKAGASYREIGDALGVGPQMARIRVMWHIRDTGDAVFTDAVSRIRASKSEAERAEYRRAITRRVNDLTSDEAPSI